MSVRKDKKATTLLQRDISRMVSINTQIPVTEVELMFKSLEKFLIIAADRGYTVNLPGSVGQMIPLTVEARKEGDVERYYGNMITTQEEIDKYNSKPLTQRDKEFYFDEDGNIWARYIRDTIEYNYPHFRTLRSSREKCLAERKKQNAKNYV